MEMKRWKQFESHKQFRLLITPKHDKMTKMYGVFCNFEVMVLIRFPKRLKGLAFFCLNHTEY